MGRGREAGKQVSFCHIVYVEDAPEMMKIQGIDLGLDKWQGVQIIPFALLRLR